MTDRLLTAQEAERELGIKASTIRTWHQRRKWTGLYPQGLNRRNHPMFREADLVLLRQHGRLRDQHGRHHDNRAS